MQIGSPEWISQSVQQLEHLEQQRNAHEVALGETDDVEAITAHASALAELESQIETLYGQLDAVANEADAAAEVDEACEYNSHLDSAPVGSYSQDALSNGHQDQGFAYQEQHPYNQAESYYGEEVYTEEASNPAPQANVQPNDHSNDLAQPQAVAQVDPGPSPSSFPDLMDDPFAMPAVQPSRAPAPSNRQFNAPQSFDAAPQFATAMDMGDMDMDEDGDFQPEKSGKSKLFLAGGALTVIAAIVGFATLNMGKGSSSGEALPAASTATTTTAPSPTAAPPKVIQAVEVPPDTESPRAAVGAPVDRTPSLEETEKAKPKTAAKTTKSKSKSKSKSKRNSSKSKRSKKDDKPKNKRFIELSDNDDPMG